MINGFHVVVSGHSRGVGRRQWPTEWDERCEKNESVEMSATIFGLLKPKGSHPLQVSVVFFPQRFLKWPNVLFCIIQIYSSCRKAHHCSSRNLLLQLTDKDNGLNPTTTFRATMHEIRRLATYFFFRSYENSNSQHIFTGLSCWHQLSPSWLVSLAFDVLRVVLPASCDDVYER